MVDRLSTSGNGGPSRQEFSALLLVEVSLSPRVVQLVDQHPVTLVPVERLEVISRRDGLRPDGPLGYQELEPVARQHEVHLRVDGLGQGGFAVQVAEGR